MLDNLIVEEYMIDDSKQFVYRETQPGACCISVYYNFEIMYHQFKKHEINFTKDEIIKMISDKLNHDKKQISLNNY